MAFSKALCPPCSISCVEDAPRSGESSRSGSKLLSSPLSSLVMLPFICCICSSGSKNLSSTSSCLGLAVALVSALTFSQSLILESPNCVRVESVSVYPLREPKKPGDLKGLTTSVAPENNIFQFWFVVRCTSNRAKSKPCNDSCRRRAISWDLLPSGHVIEF